jgi:hypothetical protein
MKSQKKTFNKSHKITSELKTEEKKSKNGLQLKVYLTIDKKFRKNVV